jgi:hypothetical protein
VDDSEVRPDHPGLGTYGVGSVRNSLEISRATVEKLCSLRTPISINLLHVISRVPDFGVVVARGCACSTPGKLSFAGQEGEPAIRSQDLPGASRMAAMIAIDTVYPHIAKACNLRRRYCYSDAVDGPGIPRGEAQRSPETGVRFLTPRAAWGGSYLPPFLPMR